MRIPIGRVPDPSRISASGRSHTSSRIPLSRYFLLHGATLTYFESEDGAKKPKPKPKGQLAVVSVGHAKNSDLPEMDQSEAGQTLIGNSIKLGSPDGKTVIVFAETAEEKIGWLKARNYCATLGAILRNYTDPQSPPAAEGSAAVPPRRLRRHQTHDDCGALRLRTAGGA